MIEAIIESAKSLVAITFNGFFCIWDVIMGGDSQKIFPITVLLLLSVLQWLDYVELHNK